jgi:hypothetical protein
MTFYNKEPKGTELTAFLSSLASERYTEVADMMQAASGCADNALV